MIALAMLLAVSTNARIATLKCGAVVGTRASTSALLGADGTAYTFAVSSDDDHSKNTHLCMSSYAVIVSVAGKEAQQIDIDESADDRYGRLLSIRTEGFSKDGTRLFGLICEQGPRGHGSDVYLVDFDLQKGRNDADYALEMNVVVPTCQTPFRVAGTLSSGDVVLEIGTKQSARRFAISRATGRRRRLQRETKVIELLRPEGF